MAVDERIERSREIRDALAKVIKWLRMFMEERTTENLYSAIKELYWLYEKEDIQTMKNTFQTLALTLKRIAEEWEEKERKEVYFGRVSLDILDILSFVESWVTEIDTLVTERM